MDARLVAELHAARSTAERACRRTLRSGHAAEDCVSEAIAHALSDPSRLDGVSNVAGWLVTVSRRRAIDALRDEMRVRRSQESLLAATCHVTTDPADDVADRHEAAWLVASASSSMPPTTWSVMELRSEGASVNDVASSLGLTVRSVESHLLRARRYFKQLLVAAGSAIVFLRRAAARAPVAVSLAAATIVLCLPPGRFASPAPALAMTPQPVVQRAVVVTAHPAKVVRARSGASLARPAAMSGIHTGRRPTQVVANTPVVTVTKEDRGGTTAPVAGTLKCVSEFRIEIRYIGC